MIPLNHLIWVDMVEISVESSSGGSSKDGPSTPLPKYQILCVICVQTCEGININVLFPFIAFMVEDMGYGGKKLGTYAGGLAASFCAAQFCSSVVWGRISDKYGRKPAIICGTFLTIFGLLIFGTAKTYSQAVFGRVFSGFVSGNLGVLKSFLTEITDETNRGLGFSLMSVAWSVGTIIAPLAGGLLSRPAEKYSLFKDVALFIEYPYLLPCLLCVVCNLLSTLICGSVMTETRFRNLQQPSSSMATATPGSGQGQAQGLGAGASAAPVSSLPEKQKAADTPTSARSLSALVSKIAGSDRSSSGVVPLRGGYSKLEQDVDDKASSIGEPGRMQGIEGGGGGDDDDDGDEQEWLSSSSPGAALPSSAPSPSPTGGHRGDNGIGDVEDVENGGCDEEGEGEERRMVSGEGGDEEEDDEDGDEECECFVCSSRGRGTVTQSPSLAAAQGLGDSGEAEEAVEATGAVGAAGNLKTPRRPPKTTNVLRQRIVLMVCMNYGLLAMGYILLDETLPLFLKLDSAEGGFSFGSAEIGILLSVSGMVMVLFTAFVLPVVAAKSKKWLFNTGITGAIPTTFAWPILARLNATVFNTWSPSMQSSVVWPSLIFCCVVKNIMATMVFTAMMIQVNHCVYDEDLGVVNGFGQSLASLARAAGPALGGILWSFSVEYKFVFCNFIAVSLILLVCQWINYILPASLDVKKSRKPKKDKGNLVGVDKRLKTDSGSVSTDLDEVCVQGLGMGLGRGDEIKSDEFFSPATPPHDHDRRDDAKYVEMGRVKLGKPT